MRRGTIIDYLADALGDLGPIIRDDDAAVDGLRAPDATGVRGAVVALVGGTGAGKTTLAERMFGGEVGPIRASADTTERLGVIRLPSGLVLVDTPGAGGEEEAYERVTRRYLGIPCQDGATSGEVVGCDAPRPDVCLLLVEAASGGFGRATTRFHRDLRRAGYHPIVVVTMCETVGAQARFELGRAVQRHTGQAPLFASARTGEGLRDLVLAVLASLPGCAVDSFRRQVERDLRARRRDVVNHHLRHAAAAAAVSRTSEPGVEGLSRIQAIAVGAALRVAFDLGVAEDVWATQEPERIALTVAERLRARAAAVVAGGEQGPAGAARSGLGEFVLALPRLVKLLAGLLVDPRVSAADKALVGLTIAYVANPIDLIPDFIPFVGQVDDLLLVALTIARLINRAGRDVVMEHWSGEPAVLDFLVRDVPTLALAWVPDVVARKLHEYAGLAAPGAAAPQGGEGPMEPSDDADLGSYEAIELVYLTALTAADAVADLGLEPGAVRALLASREAELRGAAARGQISALLDVLVDVDVPV